MRRCIPMVLAMAGLLLPAGCTRPKPPAAAPADLPDAAAPAEPDQDEPAAASGGEEEHVHTAPHGGTLVPLGDHFANLELVLDPDAGAVTAYVLGAHASEAVRVPGGELTLTVSQLMRDGAEVLLYAPIDIPLTGVASALTGETADDTSQFAGQSDALRGCSGFSGVLPAIAVRGTSFENVPIECRAPDAGADEEGDAP